MRGTWITGLFGTLVVLAALLWWWQRDVARPAAPDATSATADPGAGELHAGGTVPADPAGAARSEQPAAAHAPVASPGPKTGALRIRVVYGDDGSAAAGVVVTCRETTHTGPHRPERRGTTGARGAYVFRDLLPGEVFVWMEQMRQRPERPKVVAGAETEVVLTLKGGMDVSGTVVDDGGVPVPGATVVLAQWGGSRPCEVGTTDDAGRFHLRQIHHMTNIGARAKGHAPSPLKSINAGAGAKIDGVVIALGGAGGGVRGQVLGPGDAPVRDAEVTLGPETNPTLVITLADGSKGMPTPRTVVRTDADGRFSADGLTAGACPITVRADRHAPWTGAVDVTARAVTPVLVRLIRGVTVIGKVVDDKGATLPGVVLRVSEYRKPDYRTGRTADDGSYRIEGVVPGAFVLVVRTVKHGLAEKQLQGRDGDTVTCDIALSRGEVLRGVVRDQHGAPVEDVTVEAYGPVGKPRIEWSAGGDTDAGGGFELDNCPGSGRVHLTLRKPGYETLTRPQLDLASTPRPLQLTLRYLGAPTARIVGAVFDPDGKPVAAARVLYNRPREGGRHVATTTAAGGILLEELTPGPWSIWVSSGAWPTWRADDVEAVADRTTDLGRVQLVRGGRIHAVLTGEAPRDGFNLNVWQPDGTWLTHIDTRELPRLSPPLAPGRYLLRVSGLRVFPAELPVTVRAGEETEVRVAPRLGEPVLLRYRLPPGSDAVRRLDVVLTGPDGFRYTLPMTRDRPHEFQSVFGLLPGRYAVQATSATGLSGGAEFEVSADRKDLLEVAVQLR